MQSEAKSKAMAQSVKQKEHQKRILNFYSHKSSQL
jgi:hypothetical protein